MPLSGQTRIAVKTKLPTLTQSLIIYNSHHHHHNLLFLVGKFYIVIRSSNFRTGSLGGLIRSGFNATSAACLDFWYHMKGSNMGTLNVYIEDDTTFARKQVGTKPGEQGPDWRNWKIKLSSSQKFSVSR